MSRNVIELRITEEQAARIEQAMRAAFEEAEVDQAEIEGLEPAMTNAPKDRHVLAAAVAADSELIVTFDTHDFPAPACEPLGSEATQPDHFLLDLHDLNAEAVRAAARTTRPPTSTHPGSSTSSCAHSPKRVWRGSSMRSARSGRRHRLRHRRLLDASQGSAG